MPESNTDTTVVIPAFNAERTIGRAVDSAFRSRAAQVILVNDGSSDQTSAMALEQGALVRTTTNRGASVARNHGLDAVQTAHVLFLDADDELVEGGLRLLEQELERPRQSNPPIGAIGGYQSVTGGQATFVAPWREGVTLDSLLRRCQAPAPPGAILWRTSALRFPMNSLAFPALRPRWAEDFELLVRGALVGEYATAHAPVCCYSATGGKSATSPEHSLRSADRIRRYYDAAYDLNAPSWTEADIHALVLARRSMTTAGMQRHLLRAGSILRSPALYAQRAIWKVRGHAH